MQDPRVPKYTSALSRESYDLFQCGCDGGAQPKAIDPFGYHLVVNQAPESEFINENQFLHLTFA